MTSWNVQISTSSDASGFTRKVSGFNLAWVFMVQKSLTHGKMLSIKIAFNKITLNLFRLIGGKGKSLRGLVCN